MSTINGRVLLLPCLEQGVRCNCFGKSTLTYAFVLVCVCIRDEVGDTVQARHGPKRKGENNDSGYSHRMCWLKLEMKGVGVARCMDSEDVSEPRIFIVISRYNPQ